MMNEVSFPRSTDSCLGRGDLVVRLDPLTVLVGPNGSGKSSVINRLAYSARVNILRIDPKEVALSSSLQLDCLFESGYGTPSLLHRMRRLYWLEQLLSDWALICPGLSVYTEPDGEFVRLKFSRAGVSGEVTASSGALCVLAILVMVHSAVKPTLLLIDDIEMHLDITAQPELFRALRDAAARNSNLQIVCTTHSPFILQHADSEQVRVLGLDPNGYTVARPLSDHPEFERWRSAMNAGELWANWGEEWIHESPPVSQERHG